MHVGVIGINHKTADLDFREEISKICSRCFGENKGIDDSLVLLSTCNRSELYFSSEDLPQTHSDLLHILRQELVSPFEHKIYSYFGKDCFFHLAGVTSGLDSALIGESEIQGQVKRAYEMAAAQRTLSSEMHFLFQKSLKIGKELRTRSSFCHMMPSLEEAIYKAGIHLLGSLHNKKILFVGYSEINEKIFNNFKKKHLHLTFCNRTFERFASAHGLENAALLSWEDFKRWHEFDLIIFGTKSVSYLLKWENLSPLSQKKLIIDLCVPRNVDPKIARSPLIKLLNIDQLTRNIDKKRKIKAEFIARQERKLIAEMVERQISLFTSRTSYTHLLEVV